MEKPFRIGQTCIILNSTSSEAIIIDGYQKKDKTWRLLVYYKNHKRELKYIEKDLNKVQLKQDL